jgi:hypothetical protein
MGLLHRQQQTSPAGVDLAGKCQTRTSEADLEWSGFEAAFNRNAFPGFKVVAPELPDTVARRWVVASTHQRRCPTV